MQRDEGRMAKGPLSVPICKVQVACDGNNARPGQDSCGPCKEKLRKQNKPPKGLRGENYRHASGRGDPE